jgi:hypothetical protein
MQEINRAAALLGRKTQECNTRDKQELGTACPLDQTIRLLSSQTLLLPRWSCDVAGAGLPAVALVETNRLGGRKFFVIARSRSFHRLSASPFVRNAERIGPAADRRPSRKSCAEPRFARDRQIRVGAVAYVAGVETCPAHVYRHFNGKSRADRKAPRRPSFRFQCPICRAANKFRTTISHEWNSALRNGSNR